MSSENLSPILGFVPIMSPVHLFLNGAWLAKSSRNSRHMTTQKLKIAGMSKRKSVFDFCGRRRWFNAGKCGKY